MSVYKDSLQSSGQVPGVILPWHTPSGCQASQLYGFVQAGRSTLSAGNGGSQYRNH